MARPRPGRLSRRIEDFDYAQEIRISHDGRPFLFYESRAWMLDEESKPVRPAGREVGWWRPVGRGQGDEIEALMINPTGVHGALPRQVDG